MNGSAENTAHGASERAERQAAMLNLATTRNMLPLVQRIVADILHYQEKLTKLVPEEERLNRRRRSLSWPERSRRYQIQEDIATAERELQAAVSELSGLGVVLCAAEEGRVGFPTIVNGRQAFFSWKAGEDSVDFWHFPEQATRRPIPANWLKSANISLSVKN